MKKPSKFVGAGNLLLDIGPSFPTTRYQGSKTKLVDWIWEQLACIDFDTCLDAFGGTGAVAYRLKEKGKTVTYNDVLRFNYIFALGLIENSGVQLNDEEVERLLVPAQNIQYPRFIHDTFHDIYFTDAENRWIDQTITNIRRLENPYEFSLAFYALCQACIIKRPYNLFHRKNLYIRFADVNRSFGNKATWDRPFPEWFRTFAIEANRAVFDNGKINRAYNLDAIDVPDGFDLVYIDTPYVPVAGTPVDYRDFYHFLEGLSMYEEWSASIDRKSKHLRLAPQPNRWANKHSVQQAFDQLFERYRNSVLVVSYRSDGIPSEEELVALMQRYKRTVRVEHYGNYKYALSTNSESKEILIIGL